MSRTTDLPDTEHLAEAIAAKHFKHRGYRIMWRGDQRAHGVAFVAANDKRARYVEVRFKEGGFDTQVEIPADDAPGLSWRNHNRQDEAAAR